MGNNADLANAVQILATAIASMQPPAKPTAPAPLLNQSFNLSSHAGVAAFLTNCGPLDITWDGLADQFPSFIITLCIYATKAHWNVASPHSILEIDGNNILTNYSNINNAQITATHLMCTNPHMIQNTHAMYKCLKASLAESLQSTIFLQVGNQPAHEDGLTSWKKLTNFTSVSSLRLSNLASCQILEFDAKLHKFDIPTINSKFGPSLCPCYHTPLCSHQRGIHPTS